VKAKFFLLLAIIISLLFCPPARASFYSFHADIPADSIVCSRAVSFYLAKIEKITGPIEQTPLDIFIVASEERFDSLAGSSIPDWGAGVAMPYRNRIVIKSPIIIPGEKSLVELLAHELSHIALARQTWGQRVPRWFDEGMAMYMSAEWGWSENLSIGTAVVFGATIPLNEIEKLNRFDADKAHVAYSESYLAFRYLHETYGVSSIRILLDNIRRGRSIDNAFIAAIGGDQMVFEREFMTYLHGRYNVITLIVNSNMLWIGLALIVIIGFALSRLRRKKRMDQFDEYEKLHSTDFDYGEVEEPDEENPWD